MRRATLAAAALCLALTACSSDDGDDRQAADPLPVVTTTAPSPSPSSAPATTRAAPPPSAAPTTAPALGVRQTKSHGAYGRTSFDLTLPTFSGPLAESVNRRVRRSADEGVKEFSDDAPDDMGSDVHVEGTVTVNDGRTVQVALEFSYYAQGAAHPTDSVSTVVLRRADASPVLLADVLSSPSKALAAALRHASEVAAEDGRDDPAGSLTTRLKDWADWQADADGFTFRFDDYAAGSHAAGLRSVDVPWALVRQWVRDDAYALLGPADT